MASSLRRPHPETLLSRMFGTECRPEQGFEHHTIRGLSKMKARVNLALVVMMALAHASVEERQPHLLWSLVRTGTLPDTS